MKKTIWVNTIVYNEENFIWFALMSVVDYVDKILVWDSGSTDKTVAIIKKIIEEKGNKVELKEVGKVDKFEFTKMRQAMLEESLCDWILIVDGDEIWWKESIKKIIDLINKKGDRLDAIVSPFYNLVGDVYHYQSEEAGEYQLLGRKGHITIRAINRKIPGLHLEGPYGREGFFDKENKPIQERNPKRIAFLEAPFMHATHLKRSTKNRQNKFKYELGIPFAKNFHFPEIFSNPRPNMVSDPWVKRSHSYKLISTLMAPYLKLRRGKRYG